MPTQKAIVWTPNQYKTLLWRSALLLRYRNRAEITVLECEQKPYAVWFSCRRSYRQPISFLGAYSISCGERNTKKKVLSTTYHTISIS